MYVRVRAHGGSLEGQEADDQMTTGRLSAPSTGAGQQPRGVDLLYLLDE